MDTSFTIPWIFRDEVNSVSDEAWNRLVENTATAHVPSLWAMEVVNVTLRGPRKEKVKPSAEDVARFFGVLRRMPLRIHYQGLELFLDQAVPLMRKHKLTAYDAAYLMLARDRALPLATSDERMRDAAIAEGVQLVA